ncbi:MAG: efflux RND transporter permease subunit [Halioglobus sp.]|nr:efflux RND transporter permease subunit [Halioglobus sp.]
MGGPIRWFVHNPIAANLLMIFLVIGGLLALPALDKKYFPDVKLNIVSVSMPYPGAGPSEVEQQICKRIEEAVHDLNGVQEIRSKAQQSMGTVLIEAEPGYDIQRLTAEVKTRVDAITTFPVDAERPIVTELAHRHRMVMITLAADMEARELKELSERLRDDLAAQPHVSVVELSTRRPYEVAVEVSELDLRRYGLTFSEVVNAIRGSSLNLPAGAIKSQEGDINLQTRGQAYDRRDFEQIPLLSTRDGTQLQLGDVATVRDGFEEAELTVLFNGMPSHNMQVYVTSNPNTLQTSRSVHDWVAETRKTLPPGAQLEIWRDEAEPFRERTSMLIKNSLGGLVLVFLVLMLFLRPLLAMWVCAGIGVAFMGTFMALPHTGVSLNMISLLAFLMVLGIVVDDAIIVGESVHSHQMAGEAGTKGAVRGARSVLKPVVFAVLSTMIFVVPMLMLPGEMAKVGIPLPVVIILALTFSLVECLLILPAHLAHMRPPRPSRFEFLRRFEAFRQYFVRGMTYVSHHIYRPFLALCLRNNLLVSAIFVVALLISLGLYGGGWVKSSFFPNVRADFVEVEIQLPLGGPFATAQRVQAQVEAAAEQLKAEYEADPRFARDGGLGHVFTVATSDKVRSWVQAPNPDLDVKKAADRYRELIGDVGPVESYDVNYTLNDVGSPITLVLASSSIEDLTAVSEELRVILEAYPGVYNVNDSLQSPREEIELGLKPAAENLSVTLADLARQVREAFYGAEAQRIPRPREDVRVMVRYPEEERLSVENLSEMRVRTPAGDEVPFDTVANVDYKPGYLTIERLDRKRTLEVTADVERGKVDPRAVVMDIVNNQLPRLKAQYPGLAMHLDGELQEESDFLDALIQYMALSMLVVYALMAIPFRSYFQPLLVLTAVPFGIMGAIFGHKITNWDISMFSLMGVIAAAGVVVNDNLVLIDRINNLRKAGHGVLESLLQGAEDRFRPIILTTLTTFIGLLPIMFETSIQAQFMIPTVISLAFGVLFATGVTLVLVPSLYLLGEQVGARLGRGDSVIPDAVDGV